jgi:hypothetical protein
MKYTKPDKQARVVLTTFLSVITVLFVALVGLKLQNRQTIESQARRPSTAKLSLSSTSNSFNVGDTFPVTITLNTNNHSVSAAQLYVTIPQAYYEVVSVTPGTFLPIVLQAGTVTGDTVSLILGSNPDKPAVGSGAVASILVRAKAATSGWSTLSFQPTTMIVEVPSNTVLPVTFGSFRLRVH